MIRQNNIDAPQLSSLHIIHRAHSGFLSHATKTFHRKNDDGGMLIEVLVALLILVIVFTSTTLVLSNLASQRVAIEQRDRAVSLLTRYEEESRVFRCGLIVDKDDVDASKFGDRVAACDFRAIEQGLPLSARNSAGDQNFQVREPLDAAETTFQEFDVSIRYWWEVPGTDVHEDACDNIRTTLTSGSTGELPAIFVRAFRIQWDEGGNPQEETLIKKDPVPVDNVVFATGNRSSILANMSLNDVISFRPQGGSEELVRIADNIFKGQPTDCAWFPYLNPDGADRPIGAATPVPSPNPGGFEIVL